MTQTSLENYNKTGTFSPLLNKREYNEDEKTVLLHFFTNIDKNVYCIKETMDLQLRAFLFNSFSKNTLSIRDNFLNLFEKNETSQEKQISLAELAKAVRDKNLNSINNINESLSNIIQTKIINFDSDSDLDSDSNSTLKDAHQISFIIENVSQIFAKEIKSCLPIYANFQEKPIKLTNISKENIIYSPTLMQSEYANKIEETNNQLIDFHEKFSPLVKEVLIQNKIIKKEDFKHEEMFEKALDTKTFDIMRICLPTGISTSLVASFNTSVCESQLLEMLSHPIEEVRLIAKSMYEQAQKVVLPKILSPLNTQIPIEKENKIRKIANDIFYTRKFDDIIQGIEDCNRVKLIKSENIDNLVISSILFKSARAKGVSFIDCQNRVELMNNTNKFKILTAYFDDKINLDSITQPLQHATIMFDILCDFSIYENIQKHNISSQIWQGATAIHGYNYPEHIDLMGMDDFKKEYDEIMTKITLLAREMGENYLDEGDEVGYVCAFGHLIRITFELSPAQLIKISELTTTSKTHNSSKNLFKQIYREVEKNAPLLSTFIKVDFSEEEVEEE